MRLKTVLCFIHIVFAIGLCRTVQGQAPLSFRPHISIGSGYLAAHRPTMKLLPNETIFPLEIGLTAQMRGVGYFKRASKIWHDQYNNPELGGSFVFMGTGNKEVIGNAIGLYGFIKLPMIATKRYRFNFLMGSGLGFVTKPYDRLDNFKNIAIGSNMNILLKFGLNHHFDFDPIHLYAGINVIHFSNAAFKAPNLGINIPTVELSLAYELRPAEVFGKEVALEVQRSSRIDIIGTSFVKENVGPGGNKYWVGGMQGMYRLPWGQRATLITGLDVMYNSARLNSFENMGLEYKNIQAIQFGANVGYGLNFDRCMLFLQAGLYFYNYQKLETTVYNRYGAMVGLSDKLSVWIAVKSHVVKADYLELGLAYQMKRKSKVLVKIDE